MEPYVERMIQEKEELTAKIFKLSNFIESVEFSKCDKEEQNDIMDQFQSMVRYGQALVRRLKRRKIY